MANDEMLREMARHRGFRLIKSRRRKPGSGDYGRYGLTDAAGKRCFGFSQNGLTATPAQIESYLRSIESATWRRSLGATRSPPAKKRSKASKPATAQAEAKPAGKVEPRSRVQPAAKTRRSRPVTARAGAGAKRREPSTTPSSEPPPPLTIRDATPADAAAIDRLLRDLRAGALPAAGRTRLEQLLSAGEPPLLADRGGVVGCIAWHVIPTLQRGKTGRITLVVVAEDCRRQGIGGALLDAAEARLRTAGCRIIEAISDIAIVNAHGFFRRRGYQQTSYRFTRAVGPR